MNVITLAKSPWPRRFGMALGTIYLLLAVSVGCVPATTQPSEQPTPGSTKPPPTARTPLATATSEALIPAGWATHSSGQRCSYAISYPSDMQVTDQGTYSQIIGFTLANPDEGARNFVYVSVIDQEIQSTGEEGVYNYDPTEADILLNMQVGESKAVREVLDLAQWFTYQRMPDTPIAGHAAQTYVNVQPWEFPSGTKEIRYFLSLNGCTYLVGGYLDTTGSNQPGAITEELFDQIVATIGLGP